MVVKKVIQYTLIFSFSLVHFARASQQVIILDDSKSFYNQDGGAKELVWRLRRGISSADAQHEADVIAQKIDMHQLFKLERTRESTTPFTGERISWQLQPSYENFLTLTLSERGTSWGTLVSSVEFLLKKKVDPNDTRTTATALLLAALRSNTMLDLVLSAGANPNQPSGHLDFVSQKGDRPLHALARAFEPVSSLPSHEWLLRDMKLLLDHGASFSLRNDEGQTPSDILRAKRRYPDLYALSEENWNKIEAFLRTHE